MKLNIQRFILEQDWVASIIAHLNDDIENILLETERVNVLLSGGSTPGPVYRQMCQQIPNFGKLQIGLVDERFVPISNDQSNEKLLKNCFQDTEKPVVQIIGMIYSEQNEVDNLTLARKAYEPFINQTDIVILGMGNDGHTASIFPSDPASDEIRKNETSDIFATKAPVEPKERITCSMELICRAKHIYLLISGSEKWAALHEVSKQLPIHDILERRSDLNIYYLEK